MKSVLKEYRNKNYNQALDSDAPKTARQRRVGIEKEISWPSQITKV